MATRMVKFQRNTSIGHDTEVSENTPLQERIVEAIRTIYDPEISVNIYDLGLIYAIRINAHSDVDVDMTLTSPACPVAGSLPGQVECVVRNVKGVNQVKVNLVWEPIWDHERMSDEARLALGLF